MKRIATLLGVMVLLSSCIGIDSNVTFKKDGSGTIIFEYRIAKMLTEMGDEDDSEAPLPVSEEEMRNSLSEYPDLELKKVTQREDEEDTYITAEVEFNKIEDFSGVQSFSAMPMSLEKRDGQYIFRQVISEGNQSTEDEELDEETREMMESFFEGYELSFTVNAPSAITHYNMGTLSADKKSVSYSIPLLEMNSLQEETVLEVRW